MLLLKSIPSKLLSDKKIVLKSKYERFANPLKLADHDKPPTLCKSILYILDQLHSTQNQLSHIAQVFHQFSLLLQESPFVSL
jgi:hypothetical protein